MRVFLLFITALGIASNSYASAWTQPKGDGIAIVTANYYHTSSYFDNTGQRRPMNGYSKHELSPYVEYGVWDGLTLGANFSLQHAVQHGSPDRQNWGIGDSEIFARQRLWQGGNFAFSATPLIKLPSPGGLTQQPKIGSSNPDIGLMLAGGYSFNMWGRSHFIDVETGFRHRLGRPQDQIRFNATAGLAVSDNWLIMPQLFTTLRSQTPDVALFTQSSSDDYNLTKFQLSAVYKLNDSLSLQGGAFSHAAGRNVGNGDGLTIAVWKKF